MPNPAQYRSTCRDEGPGQPAASVQLLRPIRVRPFGSLRISGLLKQDRNGADLLCVENRAARRTTRCPPLSSLSIVLVIRGYGDRSAGYRGAVRIHNLCGRPIWCTGFEHMHSDVKINAGARSIVGVGLPERKRRGSGRMPAERSGRRPPAARRSVEE